MLSRALIGFYFTSHISLLIHEAYYRVCSQRLYNTIIRICEHPLYCQISRDCHMFKRSKVFRNAQKIAEVKFQFLFHSLFNNKNTVNAGVSLKKSCFFLPATTHWTSFKALHLQIWHLFYSLD